MVKISRASPVRLSVLLAAVGGAGDPIAACPMPTMSSTARPMPASAAHSRWPLITSTSDSDELVPISMTTNRNSIRTAPV